MLSKEEKYDKKQELKVKTKEKKRAVKNAAKKLTRDETPKTEVKFEDLPKKLQ